jgi:hypothetical protein
VCVCVCVFVCFLLESSEGRLFRMLNIPLSNSHSKKVPLSFKRVNGISPVATAEDESAGGRSDAAKEPPTFTSAGRANLKPRRDEPQPPRAGRGVRW